VVEETTGTGEAADPPAEETAGEAEDTGTDVADEDVDGTDGDEVVAEDADGTEDDEVVAEDADGTEDDEVAGEEADGTEGDEVGEDVDGTEGDEVAEEDVDGTEDDEVVEEEVDEGDGGEVVAAPHDNRSPRGAFRGGHRGSVSTLARAGLGPVFGKLRSQGYGGVEIEQVGDEILISAARAGETRRLVYDANTGALLSDVSEASSPGIVEAITTRLKKDPAERGKLTRDARSSRVEARGGSGKDKAGAGKGADKGGSKGGGSKGGSKGGGSKGGGNGKGNGGDRRK
jgi:hypothetical protein